MSSEIFESLWVEFDLTNSTSEKKKQLINISYNSHKKLKDLFSEEFSIRIDIAAPENKPLKLISDYNLNYFNKSERDCLETILVPYGLQVLNSKHPTRVQGTSKGLVDYILNDYLQANTFETYVSDNPYRTIKNKKMITKQRQQ